MQDILPRSHCQIIVLVVVILILITIIMITELFTYSTNTT
jgi:hypothetical protein